MLLDGKDRVVWLTRGSSLCSLDGDFLLTQEVIVQLGIFFQARADNSVFFVWKRHLWYPPGQCFGHARSQHAKRQPSIPDGDIQSSFTARDSRAPSLLMH